MFRTNVVKGVVLLSLGILVMGCTTTIGPLPGTVGFYQVAPVAGKVQTQDVRARKMSNPEDRVFVYRVNDDMVVLGIGAASGTTQAPSSQPRSFDQISQGVVISPDSAKKLAGYLEKVLVQFDDKAKKASTYLDFRVVATMAALGLSAPVAGGLATLTGNAPPPLDTTKEEVIEVRFQYASHLSGPAPLESMNFFLGGKVEIMTYTDVKILASNLNKP